MSVQRVIVLTRLIAIGVMLATTAVPGGHAMAAPTEGGISGMLESITTALKASALGFAMLGIVMLGLSLITPANVFQIVGVTIQNDYLLKLAVGALLIAGASEIAHFFFSGGEL